MSTDPKPLRRRDLPTFGGLTRDRIAATIDQLEESERALATSQAELRAANERAETLTKEREELIKRGVPNADLEDARRLAAGAFRQSLDFLADLDDFRRAWAILGGDEFARETAEGAAHHIKAKFDAALAENTELREALKRTVDILKTRGGGFDNVEFRESHACSMAEDALSQAQKRGG